MMPAGETESNAVPAIVVVILPVVANRACVSSSNAAFPSYIVIFLCCDLSCPCISFVYPGSLKLAGDTPLSS